MPCAETPMVYKEAWDHLSVDLLKVAALKPLLSTYTIFMKLLILRLISHQNDALAARYYGML